ncbi:hypothetical protein F2Q69_00041980 [Brassica cretica]|uniref:Uncharacterized protein n=1 Tax=Brassica cretica TaxID=69181 RepID=A0A8S9NMZ2_BRACR|nr:hypothetical protein F2Q69_00041980 [Brassica cretica]
MTIVINTIMEQALWPASSPHDSPLSRASSSPSQFVVSVTGLNRELHLLLLLRLMLGSSSATPVIISVVAELPIEKLDSSSNGSLVQVAYSVVLSAIAIVGISRGNHRNRRGRSEEERQW